MLAGFYIVPDGRSESACGRRGLGKSGAATSTEAIDVLMKSAHRDRTPSPNSVPC